VTVDPDPPTGTTPPAAHVAVDLLPGAEPAGVAAVPAQRSTGVTDADVLAAVTGAVRAVLGAAAAQGLRPATDLVDDLGADSLALVEIAEVVEDLLAARVPGFSLADEDLDRIATVGDTVAYAHERLRAAAGAPV